MRARVFIRGNIIAVLTGFLVLSCGAFRCAVAQTTTATITGTVTDSSGAVIADTDVRLRNIGTAAVRELKTDASGRYTAPDLEPGEYEAQASKVGFSTELRKGILLTVGSSGVVDFSLKVGQQAETVTVAAESTQVETDTAAISNLVTQQQIADLPLNGRNFQQLILLAPGANVGQTQTNTLFGKGDTYTISGGRADGLAVLLDGTDILDYFQHGTGAAILGTSLGIDAIAEFQTLTNTYGAQFGGNGSAINAVSKSGTNSFHGSVFEYLRNSDMDARNFYDGSKPPPFRRNQFGGSVGGPIRKNKAFFFFNYEGLQQSLGVTNIALVPDANARMGILKGVTYPLTTLQQQILALFPATSLTSASGIVSVPEVASQRTSENYFLGRFDYNFSEKDSLFVRAVSDRGQLANPFAGSVIPEWADLEKSPNLFVTAEERHILSPTVINVARASLTRTDSNAVTTQSNSIMNWVPQNLDVANSQNGLLTITGLSQIGSFLTDPFRTLQYKYTLYDDVFWTRGAHSVKFGVSAQRMQTVMSLQYYEQGQYTFNSLQLFLQGQAAAYKGVFPGYTDSYHWYREYPITGYVNDDWKIRPNVTLNLGLRYSYDTNPTSLTHDIDAIVNPPAGNGIAAYVPVNTAFARNPNTNNWDPRFGIAYDPFKDHKTSVRAGFGIFHSLIAPKDFASNFATHLPLVSGTVTNPPFPYPFASATNLPVPTDSSGTNYQLGTAPYDMQYNLSVQREIMPDTILNVSYVGMAGRHLLLVRDFNPTTTTVDANGVIHFATAVNNSPVPNPRLNPTLGDLFLLNSEGISNYNALQVNLVHRFAHHFQAQAAYTWSHSIDDASGAFGAELGGVTENPYNDRWDRGNSHFDVRHSLRINGLYTLPFNRNRFVSGWGISGIETVATGLHFSAVDGFDSANYGNTVERPNLNPGWTASRIVTGNPNQWINPAAFSLPPLGVLGNVGRDTLVGPGIVDTDLSFTKDTRIPEISEQFALEFRAEVFNIFNHTNFGLPILTSTGNVGIFTGSGAVSSSVGQIATTSTTSRQIQFSLRLRF